MAMMVLYHRFHPERIRNLSLPSSLNNSQGLIQNLWRGIFQSFQVGRTIKFGSAHKIQWLNKNHITTLDPVNPISSSTAQSSRFGIRIFSPFPVGISTECLSIALAEAAHENETKTAVL